MTQSPTSWQLHDFWSMGVGANWTIYTGTDWVGVVLCNSDSTSLTDVIAQEFQAVTGQPAGGGGGG